MIQVIERVEKILVYLSEHRKREVPLTEIADSLGMNRATCANILKTMKDLGLVEQNAYRKGYILYGGGCFFSHPKNESQLPCYPYNHNINIS